MTRKEKKMQRKKKQKQTLLTSEQEERIKVIADMLMWQEVKRIQKLPRHTRFIDIESRRSYCINQVGDVTYCDECYFGRYHEPSEGCEWGGCSKKIERFRDVNEE